MNRSERFARSEPPFFNSPQVTSALDQIADARRLVIYCGAGVTIDHTGHDWGGLNSTLFRGVAPGFPTPEEAKLLLKYLSPLELSSVLEATYTDMTAGDAVAGRKMRETRMQEVLYANPLWKWQSGRLARTVIRLAASYVATGRPVTIITTNQDAYLEEQFKIWLRFEQMRGGSFSARPAIRVVTKGRESIVDRDGNPDRKFKLSDYVDSKDPKNSPFEIVYLHGRIPLPGEPSQGHIPNGEVDFDNRHEVAAAIVQHFFSDRDAAVLVLGSGLSDQPLISGLSRTLPANGDIDNDKTLRRRFAVVPLPNAVVDGAGPDLRARLADGLALRGKHLGLTILQPDFHSQIPQFCEEILGRITSPTGRSYAEYQSRADTWYSGWQKRRDARGPRKTYKDMRRSLKALREALQFGSNYTWKDEPMRLELWVHDPGKRLLRLSASSAGELRDPYLAPEADLSRATANSSVKAFIEGRAFFNTFDELALNAYGKNSGRTSMWRYFLSVPIEVTHENFTSRVGVVTLALSDKKSIVKKAVETWPKTMLEVVEEMRFRGQELLRGQAIDPTDADAIEALLKS